MVQLSIEQRPEKGGQKTLKKEGKMPAVFYGRKEKSTPIALVLRDFEKAWKKAGESSIVTLSGVGEDKDALIHDVDVDPITGIPRHVDFYVVEKGRTVQVAVPLEFIGVSAVVKELGGNLVKVAHELEIEALPNNLPQSIAVDISLLNAFGTRITIADLALPEGVTALGDPEATIIIAEEAKEEELETPPEAIDMEAIEVEKKGKEPLEGGEPSEAGAETVSKKEEKK